MGISIEQNGSSVRVAGKGLRGLEKPSGVLDVGNSGTTLRLMTGILCGQKFDSAVTGDASIQKRPMDRVFAPLKMMGGEFSSNNYVPCTIYGRPLTGVSYTMPIASAQVKSAIILASLYAKEPTYIIEPVESRDHTEIMLKGFGADITKKDGQIISRPVSELYGQNISVPGDISSAAFFVCLLVLYGP
jgi:3-phosphoshikimate 1-carboxyvinyltransferase